MRAHRMPDGKLFALSGFGSRRTTMNGFDWLSIVYPGFDGVIVDAISLSV
jgi:hypothetical protein